MRLSEVYFICKNALDNWVDPEFNEHERRGTSNDYSLKNITELRETIGPLRQVDCLQEIIAAIGDDFHDLDESPYHEYFDNTRKTHGNYQIQNLKRQIATICKLYESMGLSLKDDQTGFDVRLPANISLEGISRCTHDLDLILNKCPIFSGIDSTVSFARTDVGSVWLTFAVAGLATLSFLKALAHLIDKAIIIRSHHLTVKEQEARVRELELSTEAAESLIKAYTEINEKLLEKAVQELAKEHDITSAEDQERVRAAVKTLSDWMDKGLQIYPSLSAPQEVKSVFPPLERQSLNESEIKMLASSEKGDS